MGKKGTRRLVIVMPAYNEESEIGKVVDSIPRKSLNPINTVVLLVDDGSADSTVNRARRAGVDFIVRHKQNRGVGAAIKTGIDAALHLKADWICLIDSDNQFDSSQIPLIMKPLIENKVDLVVGTRFHDGNCLSGSSFMRNVGNKLVAKFLSILTKWNVSDAESGFRALNRKAAESLSLFGIFTFTHEMMLELSLKGFKMTEVPVIVRYKSGRRSRAVKSIPSYAIGVLGIICMKAAQLIGNAIVRRFSRGIRSISSVS